MKIINRWFFEGKSFPPYFFGNTEKCLDALEMNWWKINQEASQFMSLMYKYCRYKQPGIFQNMQQQHHWLLRSDHLPVEMTAILFMENPLNDTVGIRNFVYRYIIHHFRRTVAVYVACETSISIKWGITQERSNFRHLRRLKWDNFFKSSAFFAQHWSEETNPYISYFPVKLFLLKENYSSQFYLQSPNGVTSCGTSIQ